MIVFIALILIRDLFQLHIEMFLSHMKIQDIKSDLSVIALTVVLIVSAAIKHINIVEMKLY